MIIKTIFKINPLVYFLAIVSILTASFKNFFIIISLIIIHEIGHSLAAYLFHIPVKEIKIYPLGGISKFDMDLNVEIKKEWFILIMGPIFQCAAYIFLQRIMPNSKEVIKQYHQGILLFNLLPIYPLDGGRLLNLVLEMIFPYRMSLKLGTIVSYLLIIILFLLEKPNTMNSMICFLMLSYLVTKEANKIEFLYEKFLLERYLKKYSFPKIKIITKGYNFYREKKHLIKREKGYELEVNYLWKKYNKI